MKLVRHLVLKCMQFNIHFKAKHIPGKHNVLADLLSRSRLQDARSICAVVGTNRHSNTRPPSTSSLVGLRKTILKAALAPSSRKSYKKHLQRLQPFMSIYYISHKWPEYPVNVEIISMLISFLTSENYSASTMLSNVSAVSYIHKLEGGGTLPIHF